MTGVETPFDTGSTDFTNFGVIGTSSSYDIDALNITDTSGTIDIPVTLYFRAADALPGFLTSGSDDFIAVQSPVNGFEIMETGASFAQILDLTDPLIELVTINQATGTQAYRVMFNLRYNYSFVQTIVSPFQVDFQINGFADGPRLVNAISSIPVLRGTLTISPNEDTSTTPMFAG